MQFVEIVHRSAGFETIVIECKTFDNVFLQSLSGPDAELGTLRGLYTVANRNYYIQIVVICIVALTVSSSYPEIPDN
jgi:hypothetical protein